MREADWVVRCDQIDGVMGFGWQRCEKKYGQICEQVCKVPSCRNSHQVEVLAGY